MKSWTDCWIPPSSLRAVSNISHLVDTIVQRFADTSVPLQPTEVRLQKLGESWQQAMLDAKQKELTAAGVLIPVIERGSGPTVLLTQRSAELKHHAGQVSFPGGRMEDHDDDVRATALRETHEEVGILPSAVSVAGFIEPMPTITGYAVTPVIGILGDETTTSVDPSEVEYAFEVPLEHLLDRRNEVVVEREVHGRSYPMPEFHWQGERIWGATAYMIIEFRNRLIK